MRCWRQQRMCSQHVLKVPYTSRHGTRAHAPQACVFAQPDNYNRTHTYESLLRHYASISDALCTKRTGYDLLNL
jgi:hypothetical protein